VGYYQTPNVNIPYNKREKGELADIAKEQLKVWQDRALDWPRYPDGRAIRCGKCDQSMYFTADIQGMVYSYTGAEILALIVAHIRQRHEDQ
jgi:hypothetical protein